MFNNTLYDKYISTFSEVTSEIPTEFKKHNFMVLDEVIKNDCYNIKKLVKQSKTYDILIDVGSNIGTVSLMFLTNNLCNYAYCVEGTKLFSDIHKTIIKDYNYNNKNYIDEKFINSNSCDWISNIIEKNKGKRIFLKMDIEGYEYYLLEDLFNKNLFKYISDFVIEIHDNHQLPDIDTNLNIQKYKWVEPYKDNIRKNRKKLEELKNKISIEMGKDLYGIENFELGQTYNYILGVLKSY